MGSWVLGLASLVFGFSLHAETIEGIEYAPTVKVADQELKLNGLGLRKVEKFGLLFKVYVAALYLNQKVTTLEEALANSGPKMLKMTFVRRVGATDMVESFTSGHAKNCVTACEESKAALKELTNVIPDMLDKSTIEFRFLPNGIEYDINGRKKVAGKVQGATISKNLLAIFIGKNPPTDQLKKGLLGQ